MPEQKAAGSAPASRKNEKVGQVVSNKMTKTIVVEVTRRVQHPLYKRIITKRRKFYAHDEERTAQVGDTVRIIECRPMSRLKRWRLSDVVRRGVQVAQVDLGETEPSRPRRKQAPKTE